jgi:prepilin peptidase CpaA
MLLAIVSDLKTYKIKNTITYSFMLAGLLSNFVMEGFKGLVFSLQGIMLPVVCLIVLYMMGIIGAGDVKLLSAVGALMGAGFTSNAIIFSFICGGIIAAFLIVIRRNGIERLKYLLLYIKCSIISMKLVTYADFEDKQNGSKFHFSIAVASGTAAAVLIGGFGSYSF